MRLDTRSASLPLAAALTAMTLGAPRAAVAQDGDIRRLTLEHFMDMESVSNPQISPDGSRIVYTRGWVDKVNDSRESSLWIMDSDGSKNRHLLDGGGAQWSPDGTRILYTAPGKPRGAQVFVRWMDAEGATTQVTRLERAPSNARWAPDGEWIAFTSSVADRAEFSGVQLPGRPDGAEWTRGPKIVQRRTYKRDRAGYIDTRWTHVFIVPSGGGTARQLTSGEWNHNGIEWSPDGTEIYFTSYREDDWDRPENFRQSDIYAVNFESEEIGRLTDRSGTEGSPLPSPDGRLIAYVGGDDHRESYQNPGIYLMNRDGSGSRVISEGFDRRAVGLQWAPDGRGLYFNVSRDGYRSLHHVSVDGGVTQLTDGAQLFQLASFSDAGTAVGTITTAHQPGDLYRFDLSDPSDVTRLTDVNADVLHGVTLGEVEEIWYDSDPFRIQAWIVKPPDFDPSKQYPLMLGVHGGPHGMYNGGFNFGFQEHAANGYVVLYTNPRGSSGYGTEFGNSIKHQYPGVDMPDVMRGVDEALAMGNVDEDNLFVYGCSYGGILISYMVGNTDRFTAASANCPIVNWMSAMGTSDIGSYNRGFEVPFWEDTEEWTRRSSIFYVANVTTPTMIMTGENDLRTPMGQSEEFYQALQYLDVPTVMVRFQDEWHGTSSKPSNFMRTQLYLRKWFERWGTHDDRLVS